MLQRSGCKNTGYKIPRSIHWISCILFHWIFSVIRMRESARKRRLTNMPINIEVFSVSWAKCIYVTSNVLSSWAGLLYELALLPQGHPNRHTSWDPLGDRSGFDRSAQTELQPFYVRAARGSGGFTCASSSEPILSPVDRSLHPASVHGVSVQTTAHPRLGAAGHRQDTPRGGSRTVRQLISATRDDRSAYKQFPVGQMSYHSIMQCPYQTLKLEGVRVHSNRYSTVAY